MAKMILTYPRTHMLKEALDFYCRLGIGQWQQISEQIRFICCNNERPLPFEKFERADRLVLLGKEKIGQPRHGSYGINHPRVSLIFKRSWEIRKVIAKCLAETDYAIKKLDNIDVPFFRGPDSDGLLYRFCVTEPVPVATAQPTRHPREFEIHLEISPAQLETALAAIGYYHAMISGDLPALTGIIENGLLQISHEYYPSTPKKSESVAWWVSTLENIADEFREYFVGNNQSVRAARELYAIVEQAMPGPELVHEEPAATQATPD